MFASGKKGGNDIKKEIKGIVALRCRKKEKRSL